MHVLYGSESSCHRHQSSAVLDPIALIFLNQHSSYSKHFCGQYCACDWFGWHRALVNGARGSSGAPDAQMRNYAMRTDVGFAILIVWFSTSMTMAVSPC